jgi:hypothetical protein
MKISRPSDPMQIPTAFQLSLDIYNLTSISVSERQKIWELLAPCKEAIANDYLNLVATYTPYYRELTTTKAQPLRQHIFESTEALFTLPFDYQWVARCKERVKGCN